MAMTLDPHDASPAARHAVQVDEVIHARGGFIFAGTHICSRATVRPSAVLLLSVCGRPFELSLPGRRETLCAAAIRPNVRRGLDAVGVRLLSVNIHPTHAAFTSFHALDGDGLLPLERGHFAAFDADLRAAYAGRLDRAAGALLFERLVRAGLDALPRRVPPHPQRELLLRLLAQHPEAQLRDLAGALGVSYHRMSHLFTDAIGLSFRSFRNFDRMCRAGRQFPTRRSLTGIAHAAGFSDSAHLSHTWQRRYGLSPSAVRGDNCVQARS